MKKIEAIIQPGKFEDVKIALEQAGYPGITLTEVRGQGKQKGVSHNWFGKMFKVEILPKLKLEIIVADSEKEKIVKTILESASMGKTGDGKIFVSNIDQAYKISSGEQGDEVVS